MTSGTDRKRSLTIAVEYSVRNPENNLLLPAKIIIILMSNEELLRIIPSEEQFPC